MFSPVRISVQIVVLLLFNDSSFHLAFDFAVLESSACCLGKARGGVCTAGSMIKWPLWEQVCGWASHTHQSVGCYCKTTVKCSVSSILLYLSGIPGLSDGVSQVYEGSILLKHDSGKVGRMRDPNLRNAYQVPQGPCIYLLYQTLLYVLLNFDSH